MDVNSFLRSIYKEQIFFSYSETEPRKPKFFGEGYLGGRKPLGPLALDATVVHKT